MPSPPMGHRRLWPLLALLTLLATPAFSATPPATQPTTQPATKSSLHWQKLPDMPAGVFEAALSLSGNLAVITGGINQLGNADPSVQAFDLEKRTWRPVLQLGTARCYHAQASLADGRIVVVGGRTGSALKKLKPTPACELVDVQAGTVKPLPSLRRPAPSPTAHRLADGRIAVIAGSAASFLDPATLTWTQHIALREERECHASVLLDDGRILVVGGVDRDTAELIDPARGLSRLLAGKLPHMLDDLKAVAVGPHLVWVLGGQHTRSGVTTDKTWLLDLSDPQRARLTEGPRLEVPGGIADHCVTRVGPWILLAGGESEQGGHDTELALGRLIDTRTQKVFALPDLSQPHDDAVAAPTPRGFILFGGYELAGPMGMPLPRASPTVEMLELP